MSLVRCKVGFATTQIGNNTYTFERDRAGRYVAEVHSMLHVQLLCSAGTYEEVQELPEGPVADPGIDPLEQLRADLLVSVPPTIVGVPNADEVKFYVTEPWPEITALPIADLLAGLPGFALVDPSDKLILTVLNGKATYLLKGTVDETRVYVLAPGSEIDLTITPTAPDASNEPNTTTQQETVTAAKGLIDVKGIGPGMVKRLEDEGITTLAQLVALSPDALKALDQKIKAGGGIERDKWVEQASALLAPPAA